MKQEYLSAEELLELKESQELLDNYSDKVGILNKIKTDLAKTKNYKKGIYYHATGGIGESGVGKGLYLGKDKRALNIFYNCDGQEGEIDIYQGNPHFIDLTVYKEFEKFVKLAIKKYSKKLYGEHLKDLTLDLGFDGIRYYDPIATGEEFVLYNVSKVQKVISSRKNNYSYTL